MSTLKKALLTLALILTLTLTLVFVLTSCNTEPTPGLQFTMYFDETYHVTSYTGSATDVVIPSVYNGRAVTSIDFRAFYECDITSITIPSGVTKIGMGAFMHCQTITCITIPNGVTKIDFDAFFGCSSLTSVTIPDSVTSISRGAFSVDESLKSIYFDGTKAQWDSISKDPNWKSSTPSITVYFNDGKRMIIN